MDEKIGKFFQNRKEQGDFRSDEKPTKKDQGKVEGKKFSHEELKEVAGEKEKEIPAEEKKEIEHKEPLELKEESRKDLEQDLVRLQAEFENFRKRCEKEMRESRELGKMELAAAQLTFLDEFENAIEHTKKAKLETGNRELATGLEMLFTNYKKIIENAGVREMKCAGEKYDPYKHDVFMQEESEKAPGTITKVLRKGYMFKDNVLRHAQVAIAKAKEDKKEKNADEGGKDGK